MFHKKLSSFLLGLVIVASSLAIGQVPISGLPPAVTPLAGSDLVVLTQKAQCALPNGCTRSAPVSSFTTGLVNLTAGSGITLTPNPIVGVGTISSTIPPMALDTLLQGQGVSSNPAAVSLVNCGDSTHALAYSTTSHTFSCQNVGGSVLTPAAIPDLLWWLRADQILGTNSISVPTIGNSTPWILGSLATLPSGTVTVGSAQLNSLNVLTWPNAATGRYVISTPIALSSITVFVVFKPLTNSNQTLLGAATGGMEVDINSGVGGFSLTAAALAVICSTTANLTAGTWYQANVTYNRSSGAYAFRVARANAGSGTAVNAPTGTNTTGLGYNPATSGNDLGSSVAEVILYDRTLNNSEVTSVETYLNSKWGV